MVFAATGRCLKEARNMIIKTTNEPPSGLSHHQWPILTRQYSKARASVATFSMTEKHVFWFWNVLNGFESCQKKRGIFTYLSINVVDLQSTTDIKVQSQLEKLVVDEISKSAKSAPVPSLRPNSVRPSISKWLFTDISPRSTAYNRDGLAMSYTTYSFWIIFGYCLTNIGPINWGIIWYYENGEPPECHWIIITRWPPQNLERPHFWTNSPDASPVCFHFTLIRILLSGCPALRHNAGIVILCRGFLGCTKTVA